MLGKKESFKYGRAMVGQLCKYKNAITYNLDNCIFKVRVIGLEPTRLAAPDPKSGMSTNFTIPAKFVSANIKIIMKYKL